MFTSALGVFPPAKTPLVLLPSAAGSLIPAIKFPKSAALPSVEKVIYCIVSEKPTGPCAPPPNIALVTPPIALIPSKAVVAKSPNLFPLPKVDIVIKSKFK